MWGDISCSRLWDTSVRDEGVVEEEVVVVEVVVEVEEEEVEEEEEECVVLTGGRVRSQVPQVQRNPRLRPLRHVPG